MYVCSFFNDMNVHLYVYVCVYVCGECFTDHTLAHPLNCRVG